MNQQQEDEEDNVTCIEFSKLLEFYFKDKNKELSCYCQSLLDFTFVGETSNHCGSLVTNVFNFV